MSEKENKPVGETKTEEHKSEETFKEKKSDESQIKPKNIEEKPVTKQPDLKEEITSIMIETQNEKFKVTLYAKTQSSKISETIDRLIGEISKSKSFPLVTISGKKEGFEVDNKVELFAKRIDVDPEKLVKSELIGIKNDDVQIIKSSKFVPSEAGLLILSMKDLALGQKSTSYEEWRALCEASGMKSRTPWYQVATNYSILNQIEKSKYKSSKEMEITSKGEKIVKKALEKILSTL